MVEKRIEEKLFERSQNLQKSIERLSKLKRKILAEVKFLKSVSIIINQPTCTYNCSFRCMFVKNDSVVDSILDFLTRTSEERNVVSVVLECSVLKQFACFFFFQLNIDTTPLKDSHVISTNLLFLEAVLATAEQEKDVCAVFKPFWDITRELSYVVDVAVDNGHYWITVTARNASALHRTWQGNSLYILF